MSDFLLSEISAFGDFAPTVPFADGIDKDALIHGDDDPVFVTLPIARINAKSHNGRVYPKEAVESIVNQINANKLVANKGHLRAEDRSTLFNLPVFQWVGAILHEDGKAYGKAYIPKYAQDVREYIKNVKAVRGRIATSIYGSAESDNGIVKGLELETIDLVDPNRAGVSDAVAEPIITSEMNTGETTMSDPTQEVLISELRNERDSAHQTIAELKLQIKTLQGKTALGTHLEKLLETDDVLDRVTEMKEQVAEMQTQLTELETYRALIAELKTELKTENVRESITELRQQYQAEKQKNIAYAARDLIVEHVTFDDARPIIANMIGMNWQKPEENALPFENRDQLEEQIKAVIEQEPVKEMVAAMVLKKTGGRAYVGNKLPDKVDDTPEARQAARSRWGF